MVEKTKRIPKGELAKKLGIKGEQLVWSYGRSIAERYEYGIIGEGTEWLIAESEAEAASNKAELDKKRGGVRTVNIEKVGENAGTAFSGADKD